MKKIGLIGGTSWHSTVDYYRLINKIANDRLGNSVNPEILLYSINIGLMLNKDWEQITSEFVRIAKSLEQAGAEGLALCANTTHKLAEVIGVETSLPIIHIGDAIGKYAAEHNLKKLGLLGTMPTMTGDFITKFIEDQYEIDCTVPEGENLKITHDIVVDELVRGQFTDDARARMQHQMDLLVDRGADGIILGCTELPILFTGVEYQVPLLDTTQLHAELCVDFAMS